MKALSQSSQIGNERGQGVTEFILLAALSVVVVLGVMYQVHNGFRLYLNEYFGKYVTCLLETGELPDLNNGQGTLVCKSPGFKLNGKDAPVLAAGEGSGSGGSGGSGGGKNGQASGGTKEDKYDPKKKSENGKGSSEAGSSQAGGGGGGSSGGSGGRAKFSGSGSPTRPNKINVAKKEGSGSSKGDSSSDEDSADDDLGGMTSRESRGRSRKVSVKNITAKGRKVSKEEDESARPSAVKLDKKDEDLIKRKLAYTPPKPKPSADLEEMSGFQFGDFIKYILIILVIAVFVIVLGGQIYQAVKSQDS